MQREEIEDLVALAEILVKDLEGSGALIAKEVQGSEGLSAAAREAEVELSGF